MSNLNTPYPATPYLTGFLASRGYDVFQEDLSLELACRLFSKNGLELIKSYADRKKKKHRGDVVQYFLEEFDRYRDTIEPVIRYLQNHESSSAYNVFDRGLLPEGKRLQVFLNYKAIEDEKPYGELEISDEASYVASLHLWDLSDVIREIEQEFGLTSYAKLISATSSFDNVIRFLRKHNKGLISQVIEEITLERLSHWHPDVIGLTVPFSGSLIGALRIAETARRYYPEIKIVMGGGFPNTYLRNISDPRFFDYVDFLTLDDGERPLECVLEYIAGERLSKQLLRTFIREGNKVVYYSSSDESDNPFNESETPSYIGLPLNNYIALRSDSTQVEQIWSGKWNNLILAHGCYWQRCNFCDTSLDYVKRYEPQKVERLVDQIKDIITNTGQTGFHWVDEAIPPSLLRELCRQLIVQDINISWWGNIRFEKSFTPELTELMVRAGCVAVTGGLEVASDRLLTVMDKGVSIAQVAKAAKVFADQGILVHAYLMYGFPGETVQETVDSLEIVRQLFIEKCIHSGFWHRFEVTEYSSIGKDPERFGIKLRRQKRVRNNRMYGRFFIPFEDKTKIDHAPLGEGLSRAVRRYQHGLELNRPVHEWFTQPVPVTSVEPKLIASILASVT